MKPSPRLILRWVPVVGLMILIFMLSHQPGGDSGRLSKLVLDFLASIGLDFRAMFGEHAGLVIRKTAHFVEYAVLFALWVLALGDFRKNKWRALLATVLYAASDEFHQLFIPGRAGSAGDVLVDAAGALAMLGVTALLLRKKHA